MEEVGKFVVWDLDSDRIRVAIKTSASSTSENYISADGIYLYQKTEKACYIYEFEENTDSDLSRERKIPYTFSSIAFDPPDGRVFLASGKKIIILSYPGHEFVCEY